MVANLNGTVKQNLLLSPLVLRWPPSMRLGNEQFFEFCQVIKALRIERNAQGEYEIMAPTCGTTRQFYLV